MSEETGDAPAGPRRGPPSREGDVLGDYRLVRQIGVGGQGVVWEAERLSVGARVALKMLRSGNVATERELARHRREVRIAVELGKREKHDNIVQVQDGGEVDGVPFIAMDLVSGRPLDAWLLQGPPLRQRLTTFLSLCDAVGFAHDHGVVHRDLKPDNVLVDARGRPNVLDFGIARTAEPSNLTGEDLLGTLQWMAPEQVRAPHEAPPSIDLHALGLLLYFLLTVQQPRATAGVSVPDILRAIERDRLPAPSSKDPTLDRDLDVIVAKATEKDPAARYASARALRADVEAFLAGRPITARPPTLTYRARKFVHRYRLGTAAVIAMALLASAAVVFGLRARQEAALARHEAEQEKQVADYVIGFFEMASAGNGGVPVGDAWTLADHAYRGVGFRPAPQGPMGVRLLITMARAYVAFGYFDRATQLASQAEARCRADADVSPDLLADALDLDARARLGENVLYGVEGPARESLALRGRQFGERSGPVAESLLRLGELAEARNDAATAHARVEEALKAVEGVPGDEARLALADALEAKARLLGGANEWKDAVPLLRQVTSLREQHFDPSDPAQATSHLLLGVALRETGQLAEADVEIRSAVGMRNHILGVKSPAAGAATMELAECCLDEGRLTEAQLDLEDVMKILRDLYHDEHPDIARALRVQARIRRAAGDEPGARQLEADADRQLRNLPRPADAR